MEQLDYTFYSQTYTLHPQPFDLCLYEVNIRVSYTRVYRS